MIHCGFEIRNPRLPSGAGAYTGKTCIVLGSGGSLFSDIERCKNVLFPAAGIKKFDVMAINLSFLGWAGELEHLVSLHPDRLLHFYELAKGLPIDRMGHIHTHSYVGNIPHVEQAWDIVDVEGTSALFALKVAILLGYERILCCGIDLDGMHRFYDNPNMKTANNFSCDGIFIAWQKWSTNPWFKNKVRGVSGRLAKLFGEPTFEWLRGEEPCLQYPT